MYNFIGTIQDGYLHGKYVSVDKNVIDWGAILLYLSGTGRELNDFYLGTRKTEKGIVFGHMILLEISYLIIF